MSPQCTRGPWVELAEHIVDAFGNNVSLEANKICLANFHPKSYEISQEG